MESIILEQLMFSREGSIGDELAVKKKRYEPRHNVYFFKYA